MTGVVHARKRRRGGKLLLAACSFAVAALLGEAVLRVAGGYRLFGWRLQYAAVRRADAAAQLAAATDLVQPWLQRLDAGGDVDTAWLATSPPPLPQPPELDAPLLPQEQWLLHYYVVNEALLRSMWVKGHGIPMLQGLPLPDPFTVFAPPGGRLAPRYRYPLSRTLPSGLITNAFGFRGRELAVDKPLRTVRIGFVGASTTVEAPRLPFSAPELIEHWLSLWAAAHHPEVRFETLNAAREAIQSPDLRAIVEDELLPLAVDYVVYYEGANQLQPVTVQKHVRVDGDYRLAQPPDGLVGNFDQKEGDDAGFVDRVCTFSATASLLRAALRGEHRLAEPPKPAQRLELPDGCEQGPFPLERAGEVLELGAIGGDLDGIRAACAAHDAHLVLCTFAWLAHDGLLLHPVTGRNVFIQLNRVYWPFRYQTVQALAAVQNRFFTAWAAAHDVDLIDVAAQLPADPRLYFDAIHHTELGVRLKAWVMFCRLTQCLERDLARGKVPVPDRVHDARHPNIGPGRKLTQAELDAGK